MKTPRQLAEDRVNLSAEYATLSEELSDILTVKASRWAVYRADPDCKSDTAAEKRWDATSEGLREMQIRLKLKAFEKQMSAAKTMIDVMTAESRNYI